jgi:hypothetical protein
MDERTAAMPTDLLREDKVKKCKEIRLLQVPVVWHDDLLSLVELVVLPYARKLSRTNELLVVVQLYRGGALIEGFQHTAGSCVKITVTSATDEALPLCQYMAGNDGVCWRTDVVRTFNHINQRPRPKRRK